MNYPQGGKNHVHCHQFTGVHAIIPWLPGFIGRRFISLMLLRMRGALPRANLLLLFARTLNRAPTPLAKGQNTFSLPNGLVYEMTTDTGHTELFRHQHDGMVAQVG